MMCYIDKERRNYLKTFAIIIYDVLYRQGKKKLFKNFSNLYFVLFLFIYIRESFQ